MTNTDFLNGVIIKTSSYPEEWYCVYHKCTGCGCEFMTVNTNYCPGCGKKISNTIHTDNMN